MIKASVHNGRVVLGGDNGPMTPDEARRLSWEIQNAATEIDGLYVAQVSRGALPPNGLLMTEYTKPEDTARFRMRGHSSGNLVKHSGYFDECRHE